MHKRAVIQLIISISSLTIWTLLYAQYNAFSGGLFTKLCLMSLILFIYSSYILFTDFSFESIYFQFLIYLFLFYESTLFIRSLPITVDDLKNIVTTNYIFWPMIVPVFVFFNKQLTTTVIFVKWIYLVCIFYLILCIAFPLLLLSQSKEEIITYGLAYPSGFIFLLSNYLNNKKTNITFLVLFISLLSTIYWGRRNQIITLSGFILSGYILNKLYKSKAKLFKLFPYIVIIGTIILLSFNNFTDTLTKTLMERLDEDTRSNLFEDYFIEMNDFMLFGKGMNGTYYYPIKEQERDDGVLFSEVEYRSSIENGYLQLLLNGGIVYIVLYLMVMIPAAFNGIFRSSNQFTKACGIMILLWLVDMFIFGLPTLSLHYIIIWICIGFCYKKSIRDKTDKDIKIEFNKISLL